MEINLKLKKPGTELAPSNMPPVVKRLKELLDTENIKTSFNKMLGKRSAGFVSSILSVTTANKALHECEPMSIIQSAAVAASFDLPINQNLGFAFIVPYKGVATFQMGWKGFVQLAMRSGQYKTMNASVVLEGQLHAHNPFTGEFEFLTEATGEKVVGYVFYFKLLNGFEKFTYMTVEDAEKHGKKFSQSYKKGFGVWKDDFDAMALKTVVKHGLSKWGILSIDMQKAIEVDQGEVLEGQVVSYPDNDLPETKEVQGTSRLGKLMEGHIGGPVTPEAMPETTESAIADGAGPDGKFPFEKEGQ